MPDRIEAKVARILTSRDLVLNKGAGDGVAPGMRFAILNRKGADVVDPDTGETLGSVELPKTFVKVVQVQHRVSVARTFRTWHKAGGSLWSLTSSMSSPPTVTVETLKTDESRAADELDESESYVKIGDAAVQVVGDEFAGATDDN